MPITIRQGAILGDVAYEIARLEQLTAHFDRLGGGALPDPDIITAAPLLDRWTRSTRVVTCLVGECRDHPRLGGPLVITTDIWIMAPELGWCRTLGRYYRLGKTTSRRGWHMTPLPACPVQARVAMALAPRPRRGSSR